MGDVLKDIFEAANNRIRSPFVGSIIIVFLAVNWRPVFNLLFGEAEVLVRIAHFDNVTTWQSLYVWPIVGGVVFALASPWLKLIGAAFAALPIKLLNNLQQSEEVARQVFALEQSTKLDIAMAKQIEAKARREGEEENRQIEAAERLKRAAETGDEALKEKLRSQVAAQTVKKENGLEQLTDMEKVLIGYVGEMDGRDPNIFKFSESAKVQKIATEFIPNITPRRLRVDGDNALNSLHQKRLMTKLGNGSLELTSLGYKVFDRL